MGRQSGPAREDKTEFYARQWFGSMAKFHRVTDAATWEFTEEHMIAFLRYKLKQNMPTWKRLKAVEGVIWYLLKPLLSAVVHSHRVSPNNRGNRR